jgi:branched-chain amino acid transport system substrate-binding protein
MRASQRWAVLAGTAAIVLTAAATGGQAADPINVGFVTELTGPWAFSGSSCAAGMKLAEAEIDAAGGVLGRPLRFLVIDNQTNPTQALAAARSFDAQDKVLVISGPTSSDNALAIYGYAEQNQVPFLVPVAAFPQLTKPGTQWTFRLEPAAVGWGYSIAKFVEQKKPGAKIAIMYSDFALMRAIAAGLKYQIPRSNLTAGPEVVFPQGSSDATIQATQVRAASPDYVVVIGAGAFDNTITNQLLDLGVKPDQIIHPFGFTTNILGWGARSVGSYFGTFFDHDLDGVTAEGKKFIKDFADKNGRPPSYIENFCYTTPYVIKQAIEAAGTVDRAKFRDALRALKTKETTSGVPIAFDKNGARQEYIYYMQITGMDVAKKEYSAKQVFYMEWSPEVIPVYDLVK